MPYIMQLPHFEGSRIANIGRGAKRIGGISLVVAGVALAGGAIGYVGYWARGLVEPKAYDERMPESTQIACAAPAAVKEQTAQGTTVVNLVAHLIKTGTGSEKVKTVIFTDADSKPLTPQKNFDDAQNAMGTNLVSPDVAKSDTVSQIQLSHQELGNANTIGMIFGTSSGKIVRCALANVVTPPTQDPSAPPSPTSEITIKQ